MEDGRQRTQDVGRRLSPTKKLEADSGIYFYPAAQGPRVVGQGIAPRSGASSFAQRSFKQQACLLCREAFNSFSKEWPPKTLDP